MQHKLCFIKNILSFSEILKIADDNKDAKARFQWGTRLSGLYFGESPFVPDLFKNELKLTIPEWIVHTFIAEHVYITPAM